MRECEAQQVRRPQTEEKVLPQQAPLQTLPAGAAQGAQGRDLLHKVHKAETMGIRGKDLDNVYKRARKA